MKNKYDFFFEKLAEDAKKQSILNKFLHYAIDHPKIVAGTTAGALLAGWLLPKLVWQAHATNQDLMMQQNNAMTANIMANSYGSPTPQKDTYNYL